MVTNSILAVVVTYNRLELLKRCVIGLKAQIYNNFDILIVNNGSTDGTKEWLDTLKGRIKVIHQDNLGGAGGFYTGQKYGYKNGYEWIWMMDDDGMPEPHQLEELVKAIDYHRVKIIAPLVLNIDKPKEEAFYPDEKLELPDGDITDDTRYVCPFNGIMINREVIKKIGYIKKELFIWGDEREYTLRWRKEGFKEYAALKAIHYHPQIKTSYDYVLPFTKRYRIAIKQRNLSKYYYRNNGYINKRYFSPHTTIIEGILYTVYFLRKLEFKELTKFLTHYFKGIFQK